MRAALVLLVAVAISSCVGPPPSHVLVVRHPERKCALIAFSGCGAFARPDRTTVPTTEPKEQPERPIDEDAGVGGEE